MAVTKAELETLLGEIHHRLAILLGYEDPEDSEVLEEVSLMHQEIAEMLGIEEDESEENNEFEDCDNEFEEEIEE